MVERDREGYQNARDIPDTVFGSWNGRQTLAEATRRRSNGRTVASRPQPQAP